MVAGTRADVAELAENVFAEFGVGYPMNAAAANRLLTKYLAQKVLNQESQPSKAVRKIAYLYHWDHQGPAKEFVMLNYAYEERYERRTPARGDELDEQTRAAYVSFIEANPPENGISPNPDN